MLSRNTSYTLGDQVVLRAVDRTQLALVITGPDSVNVIFTGRAKVVFKPMTVGRWTYRWTDDDEGEFEVVPATGEGSPHTFIDRVEVG